MDDARLVDERKDSTMAMSERSFDPLSYGSFAVSFAG
jgi:hypothetical protein